MTNTTTTPPLPDWLDVDAGEIEDKHLRDAGRSIAGYWPDIWRNRKYVETYGTFVPVGFPVDSITPHACIARWAGEDADRWREIALELMWPDEPWMEMPVGICTQGDQKSAVAMLYIIANAKPHQLYRALVNVAWDDWRAEYNKRRGGEG